MKTSFWYLSKTARPAIREFEFALPDVRDITHLCSLVTMNGKIFLSKVLNRTNIFVKHRCTARDILFVERTVDCFATKVCIRCADKLGQLSCHMRLNWQPGVAVWFTDEERYQTVQ